MPLITFTLLRSGNLWSSLYFYSLLFRNKQVVCYCVFQWNTVCLELPHCYLKWVSSGLVSELKRQNRHIPALAIASAVHERLNTLLPTNTDGPVDRSLMFSEAMRRKTFSKWPHMNYKLVHSFVCFTAEIVEQIISISFAITGLRVGLLMKL